MPEIPIFIVDAFIGHLEGRSLHGNPAAVMLLDAPYPDAWMQEVAAEMNLSETAFLVAKDEQNFDLRWFTPQAEVALCGHATLASAHVLCEKGHFNLKGEARFHTLSGVLTAQKRDEQISLDFPAQNVAHCQIPHGLLAALGFDKSENIQAYRAEDDWLLEMHEVLVAQTKPDFFLLRQLCSELKIRGIIISGPSESAGLEYDFVSRFFAPSVGIDEDPVTGSAHTKLAPFWGGRLQKTRMIGYQASPRGGLVGVHWQGERVELLGSARIRLCGQWVD